MADDYSITVTRDGIDNGQCVYNGSFKHVCNCWWDPPDAIPAGTYSGCSATYMASAKNSTGGKREAVFLPGVPKRTGIFLHYWPGKDLKVWSDGCILLLEPDILLIWNDITPKDGKNVTVKVQDHEPIPYDMRECTPGMRLR